MSNKLDENLEVDDKLRETLTRENYETVSKFMRAMKKLEDEGSIDGTSTVFNQIKRRAQNNTLEKFFGSGEYSDDPPLAGSFTSALAESDMKSAVLRADKKNASALAYAFPEKFVNVIREKFGLNGADLEKELTSRMTEKAYYNNDSLQRLVSN